MAKTITTNVQVSISGDGFSTSSTGPVYADSLVNTAGTVPGSVTISSFTAVSVPATATCLTIVPQPTNTISVTLKGVTGDTGLVLGAITTSVKIPFVAGSMSTIGILPGASITLSLLWG